MPVRWIVAFVAAGLACAAQADILRLRDGTRYQGQLVQQTASDVEFRIQLGGGRSTFVRRFPLAQIKSIEKAPLTSEADRPHPSPADQTPPVEDRDAAQMLREAFELLNDGDNPAALRAMQKAVTSAGNDSLAALERQTRIERGRSLPELMAATRVALAGGNRALHGFDIRGATAYELPALGLMLEGLQSDALHAQIGGRPLGAWAAAPDLYTELTPEARVLVERTRRAAAIVAARLRIDPRVRATGPARAALVKLRDDLTALAGHVSTLEGFTALSAVPTADDDPTLIEAQRLIEAEAEAAAAASRPTSRPADADVPASQPATDEPLEPLVGKRPKR